MSASDGHADVCVDRLFNGEFRLLCPRCMLGVIEEKLEEAMYSFLERPQAADRAVVDAVVDQLEDARRHIGSAIVTTDGARLFEGHTQ